MKIKKMIAMLCVITLLLSVVTLPASADSKFKYYVIKDNFDTDLGGWIKGQVGKDNEFTLERVTMTDGTTALKLDRPDVPKYSDEASSVAVNLLENPLYFNPNNKIVIKTRFMQAGSEDPKAGARSIFKINRPDTTSQEKLASKGSSIGHSWYTVFDLTTRWDSDKNEWSNTGLYNMKKDSWTPGDKLTDTIVGNWYDVTLTFYGGETYDIAVSVDDGDVIRSTGTLHHAAGYRVDTYLPYTYYFYGENATPVTAFERFDSFTWMLVQYKNVLYVDSFEVYEERDFVTATAALENDYIRTTDPVKLTFTADGEIAVLPKGAVYIDGVDTDVSYDKATKTVTLQPKAELASGAHHTIKVDSAILGEKEGIIYEGETEFEFDVSDVNVNTLVAAGRVIPGNVITSSYIYSSSKPEGTHLYQWQVSETGEEGTFSDIDGATETTFTVTDNEVGKYLRFEMIPYGLDEDGNNTYYGFETYSNVVIPEKAPYVADGLVELSSTTLFANSYLSTVYTYADDNGDEEAGTDVRWYTADSVDGTPSEVGTGKAYYITEADLGKYIKCAVIPKNGAALESTGATYESAFAGPVADILESTNLYTNPSFETGDMTGYTSTIAETEVVNKDARTGEYSFHLTPRTSVHQSWGQRLPVTLNNVYISACYAKKTSPDMLDIRGFWPYSWSCTNFNDTAEQYTYTLNDKWQLVVCSFIATSTGYSTVGPVSFKDMAGCDAYVDDMYFGELLITDIETYDLEPVTVPESGEVSVPVTSGKALNQVGTQHGLWNEKVEIIIPEKQGVSVSGNNIIVDNTATAGKIDIEVRCVPSYVGANQSVFQKLAELEIAAHNDKTPRALNVDANGTVATGATVSGSYDFYQVDGEADASTVRWMYSDTEDGVYYDIPGATSADYVVEAEYAEKYLRFVVSPRSESGLFGDDVRSGIVTKAREPVASDVSVSGSFNVGSTLTGEYSYYDPNKDAEGTSIFKWYAADSENGTYSAVPGATAKTLTLTNDLVGKYLKLGVTPVSSVAPATGAEVLSEAYAGPAAPVAMNVSITQDETRLVGNYDFYHIHDARETDTVYKWTIDGNVVSNAIDYVISFTGSKTVTFTVTPVADSNPARGASVSVSATVTGNSGVVGGNTPVGGVVIGGGAGGSGGSGGGGGGGGSSSGSGNFTSGVTSVNDMQLGTPEDKKEENTDAASDLEGHWGREYIEEMVSRGVMSADENGNHNPDELVTRKDMLTYLFKTLELEASEYQGIFEDVDGEFGGMLQTMVDNGTIAVDTHFRPGDNISREEMCKILYISLDNAGKLEMSDEMLVEAFEDFSDISDWAKVYVNGVYANKIMIGVSDTRFAPQENLTKAQAATLLTRIIKLIEGEE